MADLAYRNDLADVGCSRADWGAIWAGMFTFVAIWSVFGALGVAIFASSANPNAANPVTGMSTGMAIWTIVLTLIAMFVGGRVTGHLARVARRSDALLNGMAMFGLSVIAAVIVVVLAGTALSGGTGIAQTTSVHSPYALTVFADLGWAGFVALLIGWLAAMFGASSGLPRAAVRSERDVREIRPAA